VSLRIPVLASLGLATVVVGSIPLVADGTQHPTSIDRIVVTKSANRLETYARGARLGVYRVAIGRGGAGPKLFEGDGRTPEGTYHVDSRRRSPRFGYFLHLDYPNATDATSFERARANGSLPAHASIGGEIGIHGERQGFAWLPGTLMNWTQGCIALESGDMSALYPSVRVGTVVEIRP
jgi:murein L,D-transpeptidase YafK